MNITYSLKKLYFFGLMFLGIFYCSAYAMEKNQTRTQQNLITDHHLIYRNSELGMFITEQYDPNYQRAMRIIFAEPTSHADQIQVLIERLESALQVNPNFNVDEPMNKNPDKINFLMSVIRTGNASLLEKTLKLSRNINTPDKEGSTPLIYAVKEGHCATAQRLIAAKANISHRDVNGKSALDWAAQHHKNPTLMAQFLTMLVPAPAINHAPRASSAKSPSPTTAGGVDAQAQAAKDAAAKKLARKERREAEFRQEREKERLALQANEARAKEELAQRLAEQQRKDDEERKREQDKREKEAREDAFIGRLDRENKQLDRKMKRHGASGAGAHARANPTATRPAAPALTASAGGADSSAHANQLTYDTSTLAGWAAWVLQGQPDQSNT